MMNPDDIEDIDDKDQCLDLCKALNRISGIRTFESCCGHEKTKYHIFLQARSLEALVPVAYFLDRCHNGCDGWYLVAKTDCSMAPITFMIEGPIGAYDDSKKIARCINEWLDSESFIEWSTRKEK